MEKIIVVLLSALVFFGLFFYCHLVLQFQGTAYATAMSIRYRYRQMVLVFVAMVGGTLFWDADSFWIGCSAGLCASALYYGGRFGVLQFFSLIALVGVLAFSMALGTNIMIPLKLAAAGGALSFFIDLVWNRELKKRNLPPPDNELE